MRPDRRALVCAAFGALALAACRDEPTAPAILPPRHASFAVANMDEAGVSDYLASANLAAAKRGVVITRAELLITAEAPAKTPRLIFANDRTLRLPTQWVPRDLRRLSTDATLSYVVFSPLAISATGGPAEAAFDASIATWNGVSCSNLVVRKRTPSPALPPSFILFGLFPPADINDVGFVPGGVFDAVFGAGASQFTVAVTITFAFIQVGPNGQPILDPNGNPIPTDINRDGRFDTAFKEIWFNDALAYSTVGAPGRIDIQTAALHEHGHAVELGHFGKIVGDPKTGKLLVSPRAVMNAVLLGTLRTPLGSDNAGICGNFGSWQ